MAATTMCNRVFGRCRALMAAAKISSSVAAVSSEKAKRGITKPVLVSPQLGKFLRCDEKLKSIFNGRDSVGFLEIAKLLSQILWNLPNAVLLSPFTWFWSALDLLGLILAQAGNHVIANTSVKTSDFHCSSIFVMVTVKMDVIWTCCLFPTWLWIVRLGSFYASFYFKIGCEIVLICFKT